jgi:choline dehydrogenase-like flavoprotein
MGNSTDPDAVVDSNLRVRSVRSLCVIDASIMPKIINANTNAALIMIGERGSDFVRYDRKLSLKK